MRRLLPLVALLAGVAACSKTPSTGAELTPVDAPREGVTPLPDPDAQGGHVGRAPRRLTVAQLRQSIRVTTGQEWSNLDSLAPSLGEADYAFINLETTETNVVFAKFLEDGSREVCAKTAAADKLQTVQASRILNPEIPSAVTDLTKIDEASLRRNLLHLSTRFWGAPLLDPELTSWVGFFRKLATRGQVSGVGHEKAYTGLCVALMTDARFLTY
jgi:hypothetical protein